MQKVTNKKIEKAFKSLPIEVDSLWQQAALQDLKEIINNHVPTNDLSRNNRANLFNFLKVFAMQTKSKLLTVAAVLITTLGLGGVTAYAADDAKPGDPLFGVDKAVESMVRAFKFGEESKANFEMDVLQERMGELKQLQEYGEDAEKVQEAVKEIEKQEEKVTERLRTMEENTENRSDEAELERVTNRYEGQTTEAEKLKNQVNKNDDSESTDVTTTTESDDSEGEPGGVGVQQQPRDQEQGENGDQSGDGDQPMNQNGNGYN